MQNTFISTNSLVPSKDDNILNNFYVKCFDLTKFVVYGCDVKLLGRRFKTNQLENEA